MSGADTDIKTVERGMDTRSGRDFELHSVVVSYKDGPDRVTLYPRTRNCYERTTTWLSADLDVFVDLADAR